MYKLRILTLNSCCQYLIFSLDPNEKSFKTMKFKKKLTFLEDIGFALFNL